MDTKLALEIIECLPSDRTLYWYFKDAYAVSLLQRHLQKTGPQRLNTLKKSKLGKLLNRPPITKVLSTLGQGHICADDFLRAYPTQQQCYVLTLGVWGNNQTYGWQQVSRKGANLVLQLNFSSQHDKNYRKQIPCDLQEFQAYNHPISKNRCTMAWARIDLDFSRNEALIEEIQTDWLREIEHLRRDYILAAQRQERQFYYNENKLYTDRVKCYLEEVDRHKALWSEATLNATLNFIVEELGIRQVFYHSYETGTVLKNIRWSKPPKSLYTNLPKKFCFEKVPIGPEFIKQDKKAQRRIKAIKKPLWFTMTT